MEKKIIQKIIIIYFGYIFFSINKKTKRFSSWNEFSRQDYKNQGKKKEAKTVLERTYNVPLRKEWSKAPDWRRAKKAITALKAFVARHMKSDNVKIGKYANLELWKHGIRNPPHHIKVDCTKFDDGKVIAELTGAPKEEPKETPKHVAKKEERPKTAAEEKIEAKELWRKIKA